MRTTRPKPALTAAMIPAWMSTAFAGRVLARTAHATPVCAPRQRSMDASCLHPRLTPISARATRRLWHHVLDRAMLLRRGEFQLSLEENEQQRHEEDRPRRGAARRARHGQVGQGREGRPQRLLRHRKQCVLPLGQRVRAVGHGVLLRPVAVLGIAPMDA